MSNCVFLFMQNGVGDFCTSKKNPGKKSDKGVYLTKYYQDTPAPCRDSGKGCPIFAKEKKSKR